MLVRGDLDDIALHGPALGYIKRESVSVSYSWIDGSTFTNAAPTGNGSLEVGVRDVELGLDNRRSDRVVAAADRLEDEGARGIFEARHHLGEREVLRPELLLGSMQQQQ